MRLLAFGVAACQLLDTIQWPHCFIFENMPSPNIQTGIAVLRWMHTSAFVAMT